MKKGRPLLLTPEIKKEITSILVGGKKKWTAKTIRDEIQLFLYKKVEKELSEKGLDWPEHLINDEVIRRLPGESAIQKCIKSPIQPSELEQPWHLGTLIDYQLPAEAILYILKINKWARSKGIASMSIRQAQWVAHLYRFIDNNKGGWQKPLEAALWQASFIYASYQIICEYSHTDFDTYYLDEGLLQDSRQFVLRVRDNPVLKNAVTAGLYQLKKGPDAAKRFLKFLEREERMVKNERPHNTTKQRHILD